MVTIPSCRIRPRLASVPMGLVALALGGCVGFPQPSGARVAAEHVVRTAIDVACRSDEPAAAIAAQLPGTALIEEAPVRFRGTHVGWRNVFSRPDGSAVAVERVASRGALVRVSAEFRVAAAQGARPELFALAGPDCAIRFGRRLHYDAEGKAEFIELLDGTLSATGERELLNPPVPEGRDPGGVAVAMVDAGVNYRLPSIAARLARDRNGRALGFDYWDMDSRPFDANLAGSPFFPQRHGTQTASVILREAPAARLVPYRYPRPDMSRMAALIADAAAHGVSIVNLSLGSRSLSDWQAFRREAEARPDMLFIVSAGNDGRDLDLDPVYPAALALPNLISVSSSDALGHPALGSNWGQRTVDLLVPAENISATGFDGATTRVSGSSYAAARVTALAARLLARNPHWRAPELKSAILALARQPSQGELRYVAHGVITDPLADDARALPAAVAEISRRRLDARVLRPRESQESGPTHGLRLALVLLDGSGWSPAAVEPMVTDTASILAPCHVAVTEATIHVLSVPERYLDLRLDTASALAALVPYPRPAVYFIRDTRREDEYEAEAFGPSNSRRWPALTNTVWVVHGIRDAGIALAHELTHVLSDSGAHSDEAGNLMREQTTPGNTHLTEAQCERLRQNSTERGLLFPLNRR